MRRQSAKSGVSFSKRWRKALNAWSRKLPHFRRRLPALAQDWMNSPFSLAVIVFLGAGVASVVRLADKTHLSGVAAAAPTALVPLLSQNIDGTDTALKLPDQPWKYFKPYWMATRAMLPVEPNAPEFDLMEKAKTIVADPKEKIEVDFRVPSYMKERVEFWVLIHTIFGSKTRLVHDRQDPSLIYGFIDLRPLYRINGPGPETETKAYRIEKEIMKELRNRLQLAGSAKTADQLDASTIRLRDFMAKKGIHNPANLAKTIAMLRTQTGQSDEFISALHRSKQLLPHIESVFRKQGLPVALGRIPFVESSFNARAASKVGAVGVWQFMPETARQMISPTDTKAWADPLKQTVAATRLIKIFRNLLPDWGTAVTSYNSGVGRLQRLVKKYRATNLAPILASEEDDGLGFAGKNFYAQFLSANLVEAYKDELFGGLIETVDLNLVFKGLDPFPSEKCEM
jgi:hypothetical protein